MLGIPAREVHVCGDDSALPLLQAMCRENNEELEVRCLIPVCAFCKLARYASCSV